MIETKEQKTDNGSGDVMAKARASKRKRKAPVRRAVVPVSEVTWYLLGRKNDSVASEVISTYPNRARLAKGYASMLPMIERMYTEVSCIRGKDYEVADLL